MHEGDEYFRKSLDVAKRMGSRTLLDRLVSDKSGNLFYRCKFLNHVIPVTICMGGVMVIFLPGSSLS